MKHWLYDIVTVVGVLLLCLLMLGFAVIVHQQWQRAARLESRQAAREARRELARLAHEPYCPWCVHEALSNARLLTHDLEIGPLGLPRVCGEHALTATFGPRAAAQVRGTSDDVRTLN